VEYPNTLESRLFGESKMKIARTIWSHVGLLRELAAQKMLGRRTPLPAAAVQPAAAAPEAPAPRGDAT
jgi:hypothetical protein